MNEPQIFQLYRDSLQSAGTSFEFSLSPFDRLNLPLWCVALVGADGALSDGFGYGPTLERAQASAWGETVEWFFAREALKTMPRRRASFAALENALDPRSLCLHAGEPFDESEEREWVEVTRHPDKVKRWIPIEFVAPRAADIGAGRKAEEFLVVPITNGLGTGPSYEHALGHGILELLQRDGNSVAYRAMDHGVQIILDEVRNPQTRELLAYLDAQNVEILVKLATTDFDMVNLYVVGYDRNLEDAAQPITLSACGEATHPDREFALQKALREFTMARARKAFNHGPLDPVRQNTPRGYLEAFGTPAALRSEDDRALREMQEWAGLPHQEFFKTLEPIFQVRERVCFSELPTVEPAEVADARDRLDLLTQRLNAEKLEIYWADFTPPGSPVHVGKAIIPGLEVETMTYERIGIRNSKRLLERDSSLVQKQPSKNSKRIILSHQDEQKTGALWFDSAEKERIVGPLYPLYREPGRHVIGLLQEQSR